MIVSTPAAARTSGRPPGKSAAAFRTIAEVAAELDLPSHVLRFWESKFPQIKPLKRRGGRRYYRPEDVTLLRRVRGLLYVEGYTIKGVQRLLREGAAPTEGDEREPAGAREPEDEREAQPFPGLPVALRENVGALDPGARAVLRGVLEEIEDLRALLPPAD